MWTRSFEFDTQKRCEDCLLASSSLNPYMLFYLRGRREMGMRRLSFCGHVWTWTCCQKFLRKQVVHCENIGFFFQIPILSLRRDSLVSQPFRQSLLLIAGVLIICLETSCDRVRLSIFELRLKSEGTSPAPDRLRPLGGSSVTLARASLGEGGLASARVTGRQSCSRSE